MNEVCCTRTLHINEKWQVQVEDEADKGTRNTPALFSEYCRRERTLGGLVNECGARAIEMKESFEVATLIEWILLLVTTFLRCWPTASGFRLRGISVLGSDGCAPRTARSTSSGARLLGALVLLSLPFKSWSVLLS